MNRVERGAEIQGSDFTLFQSTLMLEEQIHIRTAQLEQALRDNLTLSRELHKSEAKFSAIFNMTPDPIALSRLSDRMILEVSRSFADYFRRSVARVAISYLDLGGFKEVNDRFGHQAGDWVLVETGKRLSSCVRSEDTVTRLGGDELVVIFVDRACSEGACESIEPTA